MNFEVRILKRILIILTTIFFIGCTEETTTMYTLTVSSNPTEGGTINPTSGEYEEGTEVTLRVNTNTHYDFDKWSGNWSGTESPLTIIMDGNKTLVGNFKLMDSDGDGVTDDIDTCPDTSSGQTVDSNGCSDSEKDTDGDGVTDNLDTCSYTPEGESVDSNGCSDSQKDTDGDGVTDDIDSCTETRNGVPVDENGCMLSPVYLDENGVTIKSSSWGRVGDVGEVNGVEYTIGRFRDILTWINEGRNLNQLCTTRITYLSYGFSDGVPPNFTGDISNWDVSNVTSMYGLFINSEFNGDISKWDVSSVVDMERMFDNSQFNGDISNWDVSSVMDMDFMFQESMFNQDISNWDVSNVTNMDSMFDNSQFNGDISNWDVSNVTNMGDMFQKSQFNQDLSNWNVSNVTYCSGSSFDTPQWTLPKPNFTNCNPN
jgi:surface protein